LKLRNAERERERERSGGKERTKKEQDQNFARESVINNNIILEHLKIKNY
jgi:hypothetical protein